VSQTKERTLKRTPLFLSVRFDPCGKRICECLDSLIFHRHRRIGRSANGGFRLLHLWDIQKDQRLAQVMIRPNAPGTERLCSGVKMRNASALLICWRIETEVAGGFFPSRSWLYKGRWPNSANSNFSDGRLSAIRAFAV